MNKDGTYQLSCRKKSCSVHTVEDMDIRESVPCAGDCRTSHMQ